MLSHFMVLICLDMWRKEFVKLLECGGEKRACETFMLVFFLQNNVVWIRLVTRTYLFFFFDRRTYLFKWEYHRAAKSLDFSICCTLVYLISSLRRDLHILEGLSIVTTLQKNAGLSRILQGLSIVTTLQKMRV